MSWARSGFIPVLLLSLIALSSISFAASPEPLNLTFAIPIVAVIVGIFLAIMTMFGNSLSNPRLDAWVKAELREYIAALILMVVIFASFVSSNAISVAVTGKSDYVKESASVIDNHWIAKYDEAYQYVIRAAAKIRVSATYSPYISLPLWYVSITYSTSPIAGIGVLLGPLSLATQGLTNAVFLAEALRLLVFFIDISVGPILLPLSLIIRLIPFTRKVGNTLIAISLSAMILLPFSILFTDKLGDIINPPPAKIADLDALNSNPWAMVAMEPSCSSIPIRVIMSLTDIGFAAIVCLPLLLAVFTAAAYPACVELVQNVVYPIILVVFQLVNSLLLIIWEIAFSAKLAGDYANAVFDQLHPFLSAVNDLVLLAYLNFILIAIIVVTGARSISAALGGEWYMSGIQRLV
ncbi:hypothetical protein HY988_06920 [Candidatus Micrarchaeota archaeon]|nr:hypothetical protein [Candidatus Micrarchaeota archaeon]